MKVLKGSKNIKVVANLIKIHITLLVHWARVSTIDMSINEALMEIDKLI